ncbi:MAG: DUF2442 domain-containing protein [Chromatiaceae bacterium]|nr:DUF2442 domain-containing protein [Chromatiaceae bacterium]
MELIVSPVDSRRISVPPAWIPLLAKVTSAERNNWEILCVGQGIHWPYILYQRTP